VQRDVYRFNGILQAPEQFAIDYIQLGRTAGAATARPRP
jgi:hypothetical protein